jgi:energy-coupling factor transporter ATP-binding protein EcfA2
MLEVRNLASGYQKIPIILGVSLQVAEGQFVEILGHNGMGKTRWSRPLSLPFMPPGHICDGFVTLLNRERKEASCSKSLQATAARQVSIAMARKPRCVDAEVR